MAFRKMKKPKFPPRHWSIVGYPGSGKSSFAARMSGPVVVIDADHRFSEVLDLCAADVFELSERGRDNVDPDMISQLLNKNMPQAEVKTIIVDSLTAIITPYVVQAMMDREHGRTRNLMAGFKNKALAMRQLQDAVTRWGTDVLWIYHLQDARDAQAEAVVRSTVSQTEVARLTRSINLQLQIVQEGERRGIQVVWARRGRSGMVVWDEDGHWKGMPEKLEEAIYGGLTLEEQDQIARDTPEIFPNAETAISWGFEQGGFANLEEARRVYLALKNETRPGNAREMATLWVTEVRTRQGQLPAERPEPLKVVNQ